MLKFSWIIEKNGEKVAGSTAKLSWDLVEYRLHDVLENSGSLTIDAEGEDESPIMLQLKAESGYFLVMLGLETLDGWVVKTCRSGDRDRDRDGDGDRDGDRDGELVEILGDHWSMRSVCTDQNLVKKIFKTFCASTTTEDCLLYMQCKL